MYSLLEIQDPPTSLLNLHKYQISELSENGDSVCPGHVSGLVGGIGWPGSDNHSN